MIKISKNLLKSSKLVEIYCRLLSSSNEISSEIKRQNRTFKREGKVKRFLESSEVYKHFNNEERKKALEFPEGHFKKKRKTMSQEFYVADKLGAFKIIKHLKKNLPKEKPVIEINPGVGILTQLLINETSNDLFLYELDENLLSNLNVSFCVKHSKESFITRY